MRKKLLYLELKEKCQIYNPTEVSRRSGNHSQVEKFQVKVSLSLSQDLLCQTVLYRQWVRLTTPPAPCFTASFLSLPPSAAHTLLSLWLPQVAYLFLPFLFLSEWNLQSESEMFCNPSLLYSHCCPFCCHFHQHTSGFPWGSNLLVVQWPLGCHLVVDKDWMICRSCQLHKIYKLANQCLWGFF